MRRQPLDAPGAPRRVLPSRHAPWAPCRDAPCPCVAVAVALQRMRHTARTMQHANKRTWQGFCNAMSHDTPIPAQSASPQTTKPNRSRRSPSPRCSPTIKPKRLRGGRKEQKRTHARAHAHARARTHARLIEAAAARHGSSEREGAVLFAAVTAVRAGLGWAGWAGLGWAGLGSVLYCSESPAACLASG